MRTLSEPVLANVKTGLRVGCGMLVLSLVQYCIKGPVDDLNAGAYNWLHTAGSWAAVTLVVVQTTENIGAGVWLSVQRILGTIVGGWLAFGFTVTNPVALSFCALLVTFLAAQTRIGEFTKFGGYVNMTWAIVAFPGFYFQQRGDTVLQAGCRILGVIAGVLDALVMSILILPDTGFGQAVKITRGSLAASCELHRLAWQSLRPVSPHHIAVSCQDGEPDAPVEGKAGDSPAANINFYSPDCKSMHGRQHGSRWQQLTRRVQQAGASIVSFLACRKLTVLDSSADAAPAFIHREQWNSQINKVADGYTAFWAAINDAESEFYVGTDCFGQRWFLPTFRWPRIFTWNMRKKELRAVRYACSALCQAVTGIHHLLQEGYSSNDTLQAAEQRAALERVNHSVSAALAACLAAFPGSDLHVVDWADVGAARAALDSVEALVQQAAPSSPEMLAHLAERRRSQSSADAGTSGLERITVVGGTASATSCSNGGGSGADSANRMASVQRLLQAAQRSASVQSCGSSSDGWHKSQQPASQHTTSNSNGHADDAPTPAAPSQQPQLPSAAVSPAAAAFQSAVGAAKDPLPTSIPEQLEAYIAQVRWNGLMVLVVTLANALVSLLHAVNTLLPLLPGSPLRSQPAPAEVQLQDWPSCFEVWSILHSSGLHRDAVSTVSEYQASARPRRSDAVEDM